MIYNEEERKRYENGTCDCLSAGKWKHIDGLLTCIRCKRPKYWPDQWDIKPRGQSTWRGWDYLLKE